MAVTSTRHAATAGRAAERASRAVRAGGAAGGGAAGGGAAGGGLGDLFRGETAITSLDLRLDVAAHMVRQAESEDIEVNERKLNAWGSVQQIRGDRKIVVEGDYDRAVHSNEMRVISNGHIEETVHGPAMEHYKVESEGIMAGGYASLNALPCKRLLGMSDQLCWGGWVEADGVRVEMASAAFRSYFARQHSAGARTIRGVTYIDDFMLRDETFTTLNDNQVNSSHVGQPAADGLMEV